MDWRVPIWATLGIVLTMGTVLTLAFKLFKEVFNGLIRFRSVDDYTITHMKLEKAPVSGILPKLLVFFGESTMLGYTL